MVLRDRDNSSGWLASSDGVLEERRFLGQNWRADVSLVMNTNGRPLERVKYSAYGTPITLTDIDYNDDKSIDSDDLGDFINTPYDWDLDGDTNSPADSDNDAFSDDYFAVAGNIYGRGVLSLAGIDSRIGYAGYIYDRFISGSDGGKWHVRNRVLDSGRGSWLTRDPLGNVDGMSLYRYAASAPVISLDSDGLCSERSCEPLDPNGGPASPPGPWNPGGCMQKCRFPHDGLSNAPACLQWARCMANCLGIQLSDPCRQAFIDAASGWCAGSYGNSWGADRGPGSSYDQGHRAYRECRASQFRPSYSACYTACVTSGYANCTSNTTGCYSACNALAAVCVIGCTISTGGLGLPECLIACGAGLGACHVGCLTVEYTCKGGVTLFCAAYCAAYR
ncbi:MAG: RHS repeat-associated core domain-containing protein [Phycisphaerales bacterium]